MVTKKNETRQRKNVVLTLSTFSNSTPTLCIQYPTYDLYQYQKNDYKELPAQGTAEN